MELCDVENEENDSHENQLWLNHYKFIFQTPGPCIFACVLDIYMVSPHDNQKMDGSQLWIFFQRMLILKIKS